MPIQTTSKIWHNGNLIPWEQAPRHVMSHVIHYGSSVFEGIRCYRQPQGSAVFRLPEHLSAEPFIARGGTSVVTDTEGNLYISGSQIFIYSSSGKFLGTLEIPERPGSRRAPAGRPA